MDEVKTVTAPMRPGTSILIVGAMGVGKTTTAQVLEQNYGYRRYSLAEPIHRVVETAFPWLKDEAKSIRRTYLQRTGAFLRSFVPNPILRHAEAALENSTGPLVIDDGRTVEEAEWARERGMAVVVLTCENDERRRRLLARDGALPGPIAFKDATEQEWTRVQAPRVDTTHLSPAEAALALLSAIDH